MGAFNTIGIWIRAARLRTLPLSVSGILIGTAAAYAQSKFDQSIFVLAILTTVSFQVLSNFANDYGDGVKGTDNQDRIGPKRGLQSGQINPKKMRNAILVCSLVSLKLTLSLVYVSFRSNFLMALFFTALGALAIAAAIFYTVGSKAYGYKGLGDVFVFVFFGLVSVLGSYYLFAKTLELTLILPAAAVGFLSVAVLNLNNMRDVKNDHNFGKITLAVRLGIRKANLYHGFLVLAPLILSLFYGLFSGKNYVYVVTLLLIAPLGFHLRRVLGRQSEKDLDGELKKIALLTFIYALLFGMAINM